MYPAAMVLVRAAMESAVRTVWMLKPEDPFDRERRYLAHLKETEDFNERAAREYAELGEHEAAQRGVEVAAAIRGFREGVAAQVPDGVPPPVHVPNLRAMVEESGPAARYLVYRFLSQYAHTTHYATGLYRKHLGTKMELGEFVEPQMWVSPLRLAWWSIYAPAARLLEVVGADVTDFAESMPNEEVERTVTALASRVSP
jgi:hypothetical protein